MTAARIEQRADERLNAANSLLMDMWCSVRVVRLGRSFPADSVKQSGTSDAAAAVFGPVVQHLGVAGTFGAMESSL